jgi:hypothetical protein
LNLLHELEGGLFISLQKIIERILGGFRQLWIGRELVLDESLELNGIYLSYRYYRVLDWAVFLTFFWIVEVAEGPIAAEAILVEFESLGKENVAVTALLMFGVFLALEQVLSRIHAVEALLAGVLYWHHT